MFDNPDPLLFLYILIGASVIMGAVWYFIIAPIERKNHERKLALLQQRIQKHEEQLEDENEEKAKADKYAPE